MLSRRHFLGVMAVQHADRDTAPQEATQDLALDLCRWVVGSAVLGADE